ncbi:hypothetical protein K438DRAFT_1798430 [Mycena galopus ATCC 62051]|nr:hypothetical protein K438DRAFT_1798430 [Mycena galopus ATCC 62051]
MIITLRSPGKGDRHVSVRSTSRLDISLAAANLDVNPDSSWDTGEITSLANAPVIVQRPRPETRPVARKDLVMGLLYEQEDAKAKQAAIVQEAVKAAREAVKSDVAAMKTAQAAADTRIAAADTRIAAADTRIAELERALRAENHERLRDVVRLRQEHIQTTSLLVPKQDVVERHESISRIIQAFNDVVFDTARARGTGPRACVLKQTQKDLLKMHGLNYITRLLHVPREKLKKNRALKRAHTAALSILSLEEQELCKFLVEAFEEGRESRNFQQHERPDAATALERANLAINLSPVHYRILKDLLASDPKRLRLERERGISMADLDLNLFAPEGTYLSVGRMREDLVVKRRELEELEEQLAVLKAEKKAAKKEAKRQKKAETSQGDNGVENF